MQSPSEDELARDILGYLLEHPNARDEAEGILAWWFSRERILVGLARLEKVLRRLVEEDLLVMHQISGQPRSYSLNRQRIDDIAKILGSKSE